MSNPMYEEVELVWCNGPSELLSSKEGCYSLFSENIGFPVYFNAVNRSVAIDMAKQLHWQQRPTAEGED